MGRKGFIQVVDPLGTRKLFPESSKKWVDPLNTEAMFDPGYSEDGDKGAASADPVAKADPVVAAEDPNVQAESQAARRRLRAKAGRMGTLLTFDNSTQSSGGLKTKLGE